MKTRIEIGEKTFGMIISEARSRVGIAQKDLAVKIRMKNGRSISPQYLSDIVADRRDPPSEFLIVQLATLLDLGKDFLCLAAGKIPDEVRKLVIATEPERVEEAFKAFRRALKKTS